MLDRLVAVDARSASPAGSCRRSSRTRRTGSRRRRRSRAAARRGAPRARHRTRRPARSACACPREPGDGARRPSPAGWESAPASGSTPRSDRIRMSKPAATASLARRHRSSIACSSAGPSFSGSNSIDSVVDRNGVFGGRWRSFATCSLWMIGYLILICRHDSGSGLEQIPLRPDRRPHVRHQFLANRVERRVRHLREELLEVLVEQPRLVREHGQRRVGAHRADRLLAGRGHRRDQEAQILLRVAERLLPLEDRLVLGRLGARRPADR